MDLGRFWNSLFERWSFPDRDAQKPGIRFQQQVFPLDANSTLLEMLLAQGCEIPNSCRSGLCQSCLLRCVEGPVPAEAQRGLKPTQISTGHLLACQCTPTTSMTLALPSEANPLVDARVVEKVELPGQVIRLRLSARLDYRPGQYVNLWRDSNTIRSYSLASVPALETFLEFHIRLQPGGQFSRWLQQQVEIGHPLRVEGPNGLCFYTAEDRDAPLLLAGIGTGLAPLWGIVRDALHQGHRGPIYFYAGARDRQGLYLEEKLNELARQHGNLHYRPCLLSDTDGEGLPAIDAVIDKGHPDLAGFTVYLCGGAKRINQLRQLCFRKGASLRQIHADLFQAAAQTLGQP